MANRCGWRCLQGHDLASAEAVRWADLEGQSMLGLSLAFTMHRQIADLSRQSGARLRHDFEGTSLDALRQMVALDMGIPLLPALYALPEARAG